MSSSEISAEFPHILPTTSIDSGDLYSHSSVDEKNPILLPTDQVREVFTRSKYIWQGYLERAKSMHHISPESLKLSNLRRLPALPEDLKGVMFLQGYSTWRLDTPVSCSLHLRTTTEQRWRPTLSTGRPTVCKFSAEAPFSDWPNEANKENRVSDHNNGIFIMLAGWAYVLSKKLLEKQCLPMHFSANLAALADSDKQRDAEENQITVDIGEVTPDELLWWRALLARGPRWRAPPGQQPPWAMTYDGDLTFRVATTSRYLENHQSNQPPSSAQALRFLSRFSARHNLGAQSSAALAMALTLPLHNDTASTLFVPKPTLGKACAFVSTTPESNYPLLEDLEDLSRYMTLSSNPRFLSSALWSIFWEPGVDCNAVSPWCDGIREVLEPLVKSSNFELLGHVLALRRPNHAALWYAVILSGWTTLLESLIPFLKTLETSTPARPIPDVAYWTGVPQSFMDLRGSGPYLREDNMISRADVWRLRHECWEVEPEGRPFRSTPLLGWQPFGVMRPEELELEVHKHVTCERHEWNYDSWTWHLGNKVSTYNDGYEAHQDDLSEFDSHSMFHLEHEIDYEPDNVATQRAVGVAFCWSATEIEFSNRSIYTHEWVGADDWPRQDDPDLLISTPSLSQQTVKDVEVWLGQCEEHISHLGEWM